MKIIRNFFLSLAGLAALGVVMSRADIAGTDTTGNITIFGFTCFTSKKCGATVPIDSLGAALFTSGNKGAVYDSAVETAISASSIATTAPGVAPASGNTVQIQGAASGIAVPVSGTFWQATQPVSGTFWQATQPVSRASQYPAGAVPYTASATGTTSATAATLTGASSVTTYICGFSIRANATAAATANSTVAGTITGTLNYTQWTAPLASGIGITEQIFSPCVPASATNTSIVVTSAAPGSGGVVSVSAWGYKL